MTLLPLHTFWAFLLTLEDISSFHPSLVHSTLHFLIFHTHQVILPSQQPKWQEGLGNSHFIDQGSERLKDLPKVA